MRHQLKLTSGCCTQCASAACCSDVPVASSTMWKMTCVRNRAHQEGVTMDPSAPGAQGWWRGYNMDHRRQDQKKDLLVRPE